MRIYDKAVALLKSIERAEDEISATNERIVTLSEQKAVHAKEKREAVAELKSMGIIVKEVS